MRSPCPRAPNAVAQAGKNSSPANGTHSISRQMVGASTSAAIPAAAALLRMGRIKGAARPAIAVPIPVPGRAPQILVDGGSFRNL